MDLSDLGSIPSQSKIQNYSVFYYEIYDTLDRIYQCLKGNNNTLKETLVV